MRPRALLFSAILIAAPALAQTATFTGLGDLPGSNAHCFVGGVSPDGRVVVGQCGAEEGPEAFQWEDGVMVGLGDLPGSYVASLAYAASEGGVVVVGWSQSANGQEAFVWTDSTGMVGLGDFPGGDFDSEATDVTLDGAVVVGTGRIAGNPVTYVAFRWTPETGMVQLPGLPGGTVRCTAFAVSADGRIIAGQGTGPHGSEAMRWVDGTPEGLGFPPGGFGPYGYDMSADGRVVVGRAFVSNPSGTQAFVWREGAGMGWLPPLPGGSLYREAHSISGDGAVIAGTTLSGVVVWVGRGEPRLLKDILEDDHGLDLSGWVLDTVFSHALSHDGRVIAGMGQNPQGDPEGWVATLPAWTTAEAPEPPTTGALAMSVSPNPVRGVATVHLTIAEAAPLRVAVYDVLGREVALLHTGSLAAGSHTFSLGSAALPPGVYFVRAEAGRHVITRALTVLR